jgi:ubiquitin-protein ligase E3 C
MSQIFLRELSPAIPFRILESFTDKRHLEIHISKHHVFQKIFSYLIRQNYFRSVRLLIEEKIPELDEERVTPMNPVAETIMQLLLRPLKLVESANDELSRLILGSFAYHILSLELLDAIRFFIIPALAEHDDFPFLILLNYLSHIHRQQVELKNTILIDIDEQPTRKDRVPTQPAFSSFLLYAILRLDHRHLARLHETEHLAHYIEVVAAMMGSLDALPKLSNEWHRNDDSSDSEAEDNDDRDVEMQVHGEREILLEIVRMLNDQRRVMLVIDQIEYFLDKSDLVLCICQICHQLMTYNRLAVYEYK